MAEKKRRRLSITILQVFDDKHKKVNDYVLKSLEEVGLRQGREYDIYGIPSRVSEVALVPIIRVNEENSLGLMCETFYGREGTDLLVDEIEKRRAA